MLWAVTPHPAKLGKYDIVRVVGAGAMGLVYEGFDPVIERTVAIKTIRTDSLDPEDAEEHSRRFLIEARAAGKLNHPNIVAIYDFGDEEGQSYLVMEFVEGKELKSFFDAKHIFTGAETLRLVSELLDALGYSHRQGVIHRDVKPANLFVTEAGSLKLGDFGIARIDSTQRTHDGTLLGTALGTPSYMSPEQVRGEKADARSDLYSVGVILYQFLVGEKPFTGSMVAVMQKVLNEAPPKPSAIDPHLSPAVDAIVARALAKKREDRFQSAEAFGEALEEALGEGTLMMPAGILRPPRPQPVARPPAPSDVSEVSASHSSGAWASATWVGTQPGDGATATERSGLFELRQRADEAQRKAQEKMRRAERDAQIAGQARQEREQAAQSRFNALGEAATAQLGSATEIADAARSLQGSGAMLVDGDATLQQLQAAIEAVDVRASAIREFAADEALPATAKSEAEALCAWVQEETDRLREAHRQVGSQWDELRQRVEQPLGRLEALDVEGRQAEGVARARLAALTAVSAESDVAAVESAAEDLRALARRCEAPLTELGRLDVRLPPPQALRLRSAEQVPRRLDFAADSIAEAAAATRRNILERLQTARAEAERRAIEDERARKAAEAARHAEAEALVESRRVERAKAAQILARQPAEAAGALPLAASKLPIRQEGVAAAASGRDDSARQTPLDAVVSRSPNAESAGLPRPARTPEALTAPGAALARESLAEQWPTRRGASAKWLITAGGAALLIGGVTWYALRPPGSPTTVPNELAKPGAPMAGPAATPSVPRTIESATTGEAAQQAAATAARAAQERAAAAVAERDKAAAAERAEQDRIAAVRRAEQERAAAAARQTEQERTAAAAAAEAKRLAAERAAVPKAVAGVARASNPANATAAVARANSLPAAAIVAPAPAPAEPIAPPRGVALAPVAAPNNPTELVNASLRRAEMALEQLNFDAARSHVESARRIEPTNPRAARLMQQIGDREIRYLREETVIK